MRIYKIEIANRLFEKIERNLMEGAIANTAATSVTGSVTAAAVAIRFPSRINYAADRNSEIKERLSRTGLLSRSRSELVNVFGRFLDAAPQLSNRGREPRSM